MLSNIQSSVPIIFLVTDGTVEDERQICAMVKNRMINGESICPRIYTFGIGMVPNIFRLDQNFAIAQIDRKSTRLNSSHPVSSRMPSSA